jgi:hypothetical protein
LSSAVELSPFERYVYYKNNPWAFLTECCFTKDQVDSKDPIKLIPNRDYGRFYANLFNRYPLLLVPKTRRMTMSWYTIALFVHDTIFNQARFNAFVSKKEDDSHDLIMRAKFIFDHIPADKIPRELLPKCEFKFNVLSFPDIDSKIQGFPQGADQLRQFTFSGIFGDESAFWDQAKDFYSATFPTIEGGGRMVLVSSPAPGFFKKLVFDALDEVGDVDTSYFQPDYKQPMQGVRVWKNKKNKFLVLELHYTADPKKRHAGFKESIKNSMPLQEYLREYELHWDTFAGQPVYPEFSKLHILTEEPRPVHGLPLMIAFDFGLTPAATVCQYSEDVLTFFKEYVEINMGAERFVDRVVADLRMRFPQWSDMKKDFFCTIDPAGLGRADTDERSCAQIVAKYFTVHPGPIAWEERRHAVVHFLKKMTAEGPAFQVYSKECPITVKGFEGGYRFADKSIEVEPSKVRPIKDAFSHPHDTVQYNCSAVLALSKRNSNSMPIPRPQYAALNSSGGSAWQRQNQRNRRGLR